MKKIIFLAAISSMMINVNAQKQTFDVSYIDKSVSPGTDFYQYANGLWVKNNPVPKTESRWGSFNELQQENYKKIEKIFTDLNQSKSNDSETANLSNYYQSYISKAREKEDYAGLKTLEKTLSLVKISEGIKSDEFARSVAELHSIGINVFFDLGVEQDLKDNAINVLYLSQPRLSLPNKDYYTTAEKYKKYEGQLSRYISQLWKLGSPLLNDVQSDNQLKSIKGNSLNWVTSIMKTEMQLSNFMFSPVELRDIAKNYNPMEIKELHDLMPGFNWEIYFKTLGIDVSKIKFVVVSQVPYFKGLGDFLTKQRPEMLTNYMKYNVINSLAPYLNKGFNDAQFNFYQRFLLGKLERKNINEEAIDNITNLSIGAILGKQFVKYYFPEEAKEKINALVDNLFSAFKERINRLTWMSGVTKQAALTKLASFTRKLAYPEKWKDFSKLGKITPDNLTENYITINRFTVQDNLNDLFKPIDKLKWEMPAHMVNAYYNPLQNEIVFPAGIMQAPFFDVNYEDAVNYARMGMVIGHEMTHGFDDQGAQFTADGLFKNWWSDTDKDKFDNLTKTYGETFAKFCPFEGSCVNPDLTMGENIADLGGITLAYHAYMLTDEFKQGQKIGGYHPAQRFFISYAQIWKTNYTDEELKNRIENDPHSPGMYRVNGPLQNSPEFFQAFGIKEGQPMRNPKGKMTVIW